MYLPDAVDRLKSAISMPDLLARYGLYPNRAGFICCPFHAEKTPSCKIYPTRFVCFGCGAKGSVIDFAARINNIDTRAAMDFLADEFGVEIHDTAPSPRQRAENERIRREREYARAERERTEQRRRADMQRLRMYEREYRKLVPTRSDLLGIFCASDTAVEQALRLVTLIHKLRVKLGMDDQNWQLRNASLDAHRVDML